MTKRKRKVENSGIGEDMDLLKSDVASFASSIGLSSSLPSSGFDDSDFRKKGPMNPKISDKTKVDNDEMSLRKKQDKEKKKTTKKVKIKPFDNFSANEGKKNFNAKKNLPDLPLVKADALSGRWYDDAFELEREIVGKEGVKMFMKDTEELKKFVDRKKEFAERLFEQYVRNYEVTRGRTGEMSLLIAAQRSGTSADKVGAFMRMVEDNPLANIKSLDALLAMITSKVGKRFALTGFEALKDLFLLRLLPDRKLKCLLQQPLSHLPDSKDGNSLLLFWYFEDCLKQRYERFVASLEEASKDMLPVLKDKALKTIYALLRSKPEQERKLLSALVNKLGDPEGKAASGAAYHLSCLLSDHPNMKAVVIEEVDRFLFRAHLGLRAKYHAVNFLSQILLSKRGDGPKVAKRLVGLYFAVFKVLISQSSAEKKLESGESAAGSKGDGNFDSNVEMDSRILSVLLTGINRAFPFVASDEADDIVEVQTPILFKLVHSQNFNVGVQALMLLHQISSKNQIASDRFYRALYSKLLVPVVLNSSKPEMFIGLLFKAMKSDVNLRRVAAFSKRLLQVALQQPPQYACGCLFILSEVLKAKPPLWHSMLQKECVDDDFEHFVDVKEESNITSENVPIKKEEDMRMSIKIGSDGAYDSEDKNERTLGWSDEDNNCIKSNNLMGDESNIAICNTSLNQMSNKTSFAGGYDPRHRDPSHCHADQTSWWELIILASHAHPSVATMASTLLSGANIVYNGDPLTDLSLGAFLDKFMEKKPKQNKKAEGAWHGGSQIAPAKKMDTSKRLIGVEILSLAEDEIAPEDLVFHKFYSNKMKSSKKPKKKKSMEEAGDDLFDVDGIDNDGDEIDGADESDNEEIDNLLGSGELPSEEEDEYSYDDLDKIVNDEDLVNSDADADVDNQIVDDEFNDEDVELKNNVVKDENIKKKRRKLGGKAKVSPFSRLEDYLHLMEDNEQRAEKVNSHKKRKSH